MDKVKCECGHPNPVGTYLCESCGNPLAGEVKGSEAPLDMRYEGVARRSQTYNKTIIDKVWNFFSSVKIAVYMIIIVLIASIVGTVFPQEQYIPVPKPPSLFYEETYGIIGKIYYLLGFYHLFSSWWYVSLLLGIGISLIICSIDRVVPLYKALRNQKVKHSVNFLVRQKLNAEITVPTEWDARFENLEAALKSRHYHIRRDGEALLAEKGRFSRWGPYINHVGLIIFLIGALLRLVPGFYLDQYVWVKDGETKKVPETSYYVKNDGFNIDFYNKSDFPQDLGFEEGQKVIKQYKTKAILYENTNANLPGSEPNLKEV
ncbi:MAG TPA: cytochrome c biogenesis protein ResB, partial [Bacillota bacterium]|nr:cytochrome c biogenesis protein ResB [Bacillota bacterium]